MPDFDPSSAVPDNPGFDPSSAVPDAPAKTRGHGGIYLGGVKSGAATIGQGGALALSGVNGMVPGQLGAKMQNTTLKAVSDLGDYADKQALTPEENDSLTNRVLFGLGQATS